jgi:hypothetical protein
MTTQAQPLPIITTRDEVNIDWLYSVLGDRLYGEIISSFEAKRVGNGMMSDCTRILLTYAEPDVKAPSSVVLKHSSPDPTSRETAAKIGLYSYEVSFYRDLAPNVDIYCPEIYFSAINDDGSEFNLVMEDLTPARPGDQMGGSSLEDCELAMKQIAGLHGPYWGQQHLRDVPWLQRRAAFGEMHNSQIGSIATAFKTRYQRYLEPKYLSLIDELVVGYPKAYRDQSPPPTLQHGDFRIDNILFDIHGTVGQMATVDWATIMVGPALTDVSYFIGSSLTTDERQIHERKLVKIYFDALSSYNLAGYGWEQCWTDYCRFALHGLFVAVVAPMSVVQTERGDALFLEMVRRHGNQLIDLDSFRFWN